MPLNKLILLLCAVIGAAGLTIFAIATLAGGVSGPILASLTVLTLLASFVLRRLITGRDQP